MSLSLLCDPFLQLPGPASVHVVWCTETTGGRHLVLVGDVAGLTPEAVLDGDLPDGVRTFTADDVGFTRVAEDRVSNIPDPPYFMTPRPVRRHEARVTGLVPGRTPYRVASIVDGEVALSDVFTLAPEVPVGAPVRLLLTSDHQLSPNTGTNIELAHATFGDVDAIVFAGDLANVPDCASEWFDGPRAFFATLQGRATAEDLGGHVSSGAAYLQHTPLFPAIGNHEVQGRVAGKEGLSMAAVPRRVAEEAYERVADEVNPEGDEGVRRRWIEDNSWSITTYEEMFTLPENPSEHSRWYAVTIGNVRLITLFHTRRWQHAYADPDPADRLKRSRFQEARDTLRDPLAQGYGCFPFSEIGPGSEQFEWLVEELESEERRAAEFTIVQVHEGAHGLGGNVEPPFCEPERIEEFDDAGELLGVRYEYSRTRNDFFVHVMPLLEGAGVQLVYSGHSHVWNRFRVGRTHYLEASNTGTSHGIHTEGNGNPRPVPPAPWRSEEYTAFGNPYGLEPAAPGLGDKEVVTFQRFDSATGEVETWAARVTDPEPEPFLLDRFTLERDA